jgi:AraC-like DNA-binding protein
LIELASETAVSQSTLAVGFRHFLGEPPLTYLARWRLQLAARKLSRPSILSFRWHWTGYESEAAFNRAFKREFGLSPGQYRKKLMGNSVEPESEHPQDR